MLRQGRTLRREVGRCSPAAATSSTLSLQRWRDPFAGWLQDQERSPTNAVTQSILGPIRTRFAMRVIGVIQHTVAHTWRTTTRPPTRVDAVVTGSAGTRRTRVRYGTSALLESFLWSGKSYDREGKSAYYEQCLDPANCMSRKHSALPKR